MKSATKSFLSAAALALGLTLAACGGGGDALPTPDAADDPSTGVSPGGNGGVGQAGNSGGGGSAGTGGGTAGTGGGTAGTGGGTAGTGGSAAGTGGSAPGPRPDGGAPVSRPDGGLRPPTDGGRPQPPPTRRDGGLPGAPTPCPADVATATCNPRTSFTCTLPTDGGRASACFCSNQRWACPGQPQQPPTRRDGGASSGAACEEPMPNDQPCMRAGSVCQVPRDGGTGATCFCLQSNGATTWRCIGR